MKNKLYLFLFIIVAGISIWAFFVKEKRILSYELLEKPIFLNDNGFDFDLKTRVETVEEFLKEKGIVVGEHDEIFPEFEAKIFPGTKIFIRRASKIQIKVDGKKIERFSLERSVSDALLESGVVLTRLDKTEPKKEALVENDLVIVVTRINVEEVLEKEKIDFKTIVKEDKKLGWREKKIEIPGEKGEKEVRYEITYKDGKEVSRVKLSTNVTLGAGVSGGNSRDICEDGKRGQGSGHLVCLERRTFCGFNDPSQGFFC
jgi:uncharacterized protein YabE (DUF348 family)